MPLTRQAPLRGRAILECHIPVRSLLAREQRRRSLRVPTADSLQEAVRPLELVRASLANSHADRDLIVAEDLEEDLAAAAAEAAAAEEMAMVTKSTT